MMALVGMDGVTRTKVHMCRYGVVRDTDQEQKFVKKASGFLTISPRIVCRLAKRCTENREHVLMVGKHGTVQAQICPLIFSRAICEGCVEQKKFDVMGSFQFGSVKSAMGE